MLFLVKCSFLVLVFIAVANADSKCDKRKCPGPLRFYRELHCKPIYKNPEDCCPVRFECPKRRNDKCYANGHAYNIGESLRKIEDGVPCSVGCFCSDKSELKNSAHFVCAVVDCQRPPKEGCYMQHEPNSCCAYPEVCPASPDDRPKCVVDGKTYLDGEYFEPLAEPNKACFCGPDYKGENTSKFCRIKRCGTDIYNGNEISQNCAPIYGLNRKPSENCNLGFRCQKDSDVVIRNPNPPRGAGKCNYGQITMNVGDSLNQAADQRATCTKCVCEVPPYVTCQTVEKDKCLN